MINGNIDSFIDTGWYNEATLFYNGYVYWLEATTEDGITTFFVNRWRAGITDNKLYNSYVDQSGEPVDFSNVLSITNSDIDIIKRDFLVSTIFDGKSFWEVEKELVWVDEGEQIYIPKMPGMQE